MCNRSGFTRTHAYVSLLINTDLRTSFLKLSSKLVEMVGVPSDEGHSVSFLREDATIHGSER